MSWRPVALGEEVLTTGVQQLVILAAFGSDSPTHRESTLGKPGLFSENKYLTSRCSPGFFLIRKLRQICESKTKHGFPAQGRPPLPDVMGSSLEHAQLLGSWRPLWDVPPVQGVVVVVECNSGLLGCFHLEKMDFPYQNQMFI